MDREMKERVRNAYLSGEIRQALDGTFTADEVDAILDLLRRGLVR